MNAATSTVPQRPTFAEAIAAARTQHGDCLAELSQRAPVLLIFLRHLGCTFCREALADIAAKRAAIEAHGTQIVFVHMGREEGAAALFARFNLGNIARISDPAAELYAAFGLARGSLAQVAGPRVWLRGAKAFFAGFFPGRWVGDVLRMPGVFLLHHGEIVRAFRHEVTADRPDYESFSSCESSG